MKKGHKYPKDLFYTILYSPTPEGVGYFLKGLFI